MKKLKVIAGITWAFFSLIMIIVLFPGLTGFSTSLSKAPFMKIHPRYSGGEAQKQIIAENCTLVVRKPVFKGLVGDRKNGFVQLDWSGTLPVVIADTIDYDQDGIPDFYIEVKPEVHKTDLKAFTGKVRDVGISTPTSYGYAVRVNITR